MSVVVVGSCNLDLVVEVGHLPAPGETVLGGDVQRRPGGKGANQAVAARRLGAETAFVGAVGDDDFGAELRDTLRAEHVDLSHLTVVPGASGVALIVVDAQAENSITVAPGANRHVSAEAVSWAPTSILVLQLEIPLAAAVSAAAGASAAGARVIVNAAPLPDPADPQLRRLLELADVLVVNEGEATRLGSAQPEELRRLGPDSVIVTLGAAGAVVADGATPPVAVAGTPVDAVDTTGAGDAFCGALAASLDAGYPMAEAVRRGCAAGARAATAVGARAAMPTVDELERLMAESGVA
ncbi:MAG TPA: ribokinase [Jatrophihabitantaceae bacterium]